MLFRAVYIILALLALAAIVQRNNALAFILCLFMVLVMALWTS